VAPIKKIPKGIFLCQEECGIKNKDRHYDGL
jgi:hypothetical protein